MGARKFLGSPGKHRTTVEASRWWKAQAAACGGVAPLARKLGLPAETIRRFIERAGVREGTAAPGDRIMRERGFEGASGLEREPAAATPPTTADPAQVA